MKFERFVRAMRKVYEKADMQVINLHEFFPEEEYNDALFSLTDNEVNQFLSYCKEFLKEHYYIGVVAELHYLVYGN